MLSLLTGGAAFVGTLLGGPLADRLSRRDMRLMLRVPAAAYLIAAPALAIAYASSDLVILIGLITVGQIAATVYLGPTFGALHNMVQPRMRATAVAAVFMVVSLVGLGLGPVLIGALSDYAAQALDSGGPASCQVGAGDPCPDIGFAGLRMAMIVASVFYLLPAYFYYRAGSTLPESLLSNRRASS